jgi:hypothetical protein
MGKNASKNFVNQFKNTRRQAGRRPFVGQGGLEQKKLFKGPVRHLKKLFPGKPKDEKIPDHGDK